jgi:hypothetical protein
MDDHQFAASVREVTGKATNEEALAALGGTEVPSLEEKLEAVREKVVHYFRTRWNEMKRKPNEDEAVQIVMDGFSALDDDDKDDEPLTAPTS